MQIQSPQNKDLGHHFEFFFNKFFRVFIIGIVVLVLVLGYYLVIKKQYNNFKISQDIILSGLQNEVGYLLRQKESTILYVDSSVEFNKPEEDLLDLALPQEFIFSSLVIQLNKLADNHGFVVNKISNNGLALESIDSSSDNLKMMNIDIELYGSDYEEFKNFVSALENSFMIFDVQSISFESEISPSSIYSLNLVAYYFSQ